MRRRVLLAVCLLAACTEPDLPRIGVAVSTRPAEGARLAVAEAQAQRGVGFEAWVRPTAAATDSVLAVAEAFALDRAVVAVIGHSNSAASLAASQVYNRAGLVQVAPTTTSTAYGAAGHYSFRMVPGDESQAAFIADRALRDWQPAGRIAVVYVNDDYGRSLYRSLRPRLGNVVMDGIYSELMDNAHLEPLRHQVQRARPDLLVWLGRPARLAQVLSGLRQDLPGLRVLCGDGCDEHRLFANEGGVFDGVRFVRFIDLATDAPELEPFRRSYRDAAGVDPGAEAILAHDAMLVIASALAEGARTREQVRAYLMSLGRDRPPVDGLAGPIAFDEEGSVMRRYGLAEVTANGVRSLPTPGGQ